MLGPRKDMLGLYFCPFRLRGMQDADTNQSKYFITGDMQREKREIAVRDLLLKAFFIWWVEKGVFYVSDCVCVGGGGEGWQLTSTPPHSDSLEYRC